MSTEKHSKYNFQKNTSNKITQKYTVKQALVNYFIIVMFTLFPLFFTNMFFNIRHDKYYLFIILSGVVIIAELLMVLTETTDNNKVKNDSEKVKEIKWYKKLSFTDWAVLAFIASNIISTLFSVNREAALFGEASGIGSSGRNNGLVLMLIYAGVYFLVTRLFRYYEYIFAAFTISSAIVFILAILNSFYIDPIGMFSNLSGKQELIFISTIGNINLLSSYICIALPVSITMAIHTNSKALRALYLAVSGLGFAALMVADSDSGILGIGVFLLIFLVWYSRRIDRLKVYFLAITVMLLSAKILRLFSLAMNDKNKGMDAFQKLFVYNNKSYIFLAVSACITIALYLISHKKPKLVLSKAVPIVLGGAVAAAAVALISTVVYYSYFDTTTQLGSFEKILRFNDKWGTHRGFMWIRSFWIFGDTSIFRKLFGTGPDTFYFAFRPYFTDLLKYGDSSTNAAHNEYINYLITIGITGLGSYLAILGGTIARAVKYAKKNPLTIVCVSAVICYSIQAFVNIAQPITTPLFIIFISLCESASRATKSV